MRSTEVYKLLDKNVSENLKIIGYKKGKSGMLAYTKKVNDLYISFWFQCSQDGYDKFTGSKFVVEFSVTNNDIIGSKSIERHRLPYFLNQEHLRDITNLQNKIIKKMSHPPSTHYIFQMSENIKKWFLHKFQQEKEIYTSKNDIWFRYKIEDDVNSWGKFLSPIIVQTLNELEIKYSKFTDH